jgi:hypothetical protein
MRPALALIVAGCFLGCGDNPTPYSLISGLRLLGAKSEPAEAAPGDAVKLTAYAVNLDGSVITVDWAACAVAPAPGTGTINDACITSEGAPDLVPLGSGAMVRAALPSVPREVLGDPDFTGGIYLPIRLRVQDATGASQGGKGIDGVYRMRISQGGPPNHNPTLQEIFTVTGAADGSVASRTVLDEATPLPVRSGDALTLRATFTADSAETYMGPAGDGTIVPVVETPSVSWFTTGGSWSNDRTDPDSDTVLRLDQHLPAPSGKIDLYILGRDGRGGLDYAHRALQLQ